MQAHKATIMKAYKVLSETKCPYKNNQSTPKQREEWEEVHNSCKAKLYSLLAGQRIG